MLLAPHSDEALPSFRSRLPLRLGGSCAVAPVGAAAGAPKRVLNLNSNTLVAGLAWAGGQGMGQGRRSVGKGKGGLSHHKQFPFHLPKHPPVTTKQVAMLPRTPCACLG